MHGKRVLAALGAVLWILAAAGAEAASIKAQSVKGSGEFEKPAALIIDQAMPEDGADFDGDRCVHWFGPKTFFTIDLGSVYTVEHLTIQADNNDDYFIETSLNGQAFQPLIKVDWEWGEIPFGMETHSSLPSDPKHEPKMTFPPRQARYLKVYARGGDDSYAVSEVLVFGEKVKDTAGAPKVSDPSELTAKPMVPPKAPPAGPATESEDESLESVFKKLDANADGRIDPAEFKVIWKSQADADRNFKFFDKNKNGFIERAEYVDLPGQMGKGAAAPGGAGGQPRK